MRTTLTINQIIDEWMSETDALESTKADYRCKIGLWFRWLALQKIDPRNPTRAHIIDYKHTCRSSARASSPSAAM